MVCIAINLLLLLSLTALSILSVTSATTIGVTYSTSFSVGVAPERVAEKVVSMKIPAVRLLDSNPAMIGAFAYTNVSLFLSIPNPLVPLLASNSAVAKQWVHRHVLPFYPHTKISIISVGNDDIADSPDVSRFLLRAMQHVRRSLKDHRIYKISVSTTFSLFNIVSMARPPSAARFQQPNGEVILRPILQFLERTNSSFLINLHPYSLYRSSWTFTIGFCLLQVSPYGFITDPATGIKYTNLFDVMLDSLVRSLADMGHAKIPVIVAETGWPSSGIDASEVDATLLYGRLFFTSLIAHLRGNGTTLKNRGPSEVYLFELLDKDCDGLRNWGLLYNNMTNKYGELVYAVDHHDPIIDPLVAGLVIGAILGVGVLIFGIRRGWTYEDFEKFFDFLRKILDHLKR
ncbi:unnamed protein product [Microthlaspi erraticum]|uniref:glucan endo-1,3-beta-D-glucosidase n=1 Tax=Microthlaspi erraticum TaxID=1685480 RepID=A0A6D2KJ48_9BRAS|nr:unnamed protein product [Microthlaspi erraticum]